MAETERAALCAGFSAGGAGKEAGRARVQCLSLPGGEGRWRVTVTLEAERDVPEALLFTNRRRLAFRGALKAGERREMTVLAGVHPFLEEGQDAPNPCAGPELALAADGARIADAHAERADGRALLLLGDSTVTDQPSQSPYAPGATYAGWGQMLPERVGRSAFVLNFAQSGLTTETFRTDGYDALLRAAARPGDVALIQFGHNDQKRANLTARGGYARALRGYMEEMRALGVTPVLVTPLARNSWHSGGTYLDLLLPFANAMRSVARAEGVPLIDLHGFMKRTLLRLGRDDAKPLFHEGDYTHTNDFGAYLAAGFVAGELARLGLADAQEKGAWTPHGPYGVPAADLGDELPAPSGLDALYDSFERERPDARLTRLEAVRLAVRMAGLFAHNGPCRLPEDVPLGEEWSADVRAALQNGVLPGEMLADGRFHRHRPISGAELRALLSAAYGMRCDPDAVPEMPQAVTRAQAAAVCRALKI